MVKRPMRKKRTIIAPSVLSADFSRLGAEVRSVEKAGADWIHVDVMDGHFVPNITIGPVVVKGLRAATALPLDVHLMIAQPEKYIVPFAQAGSDYITVHYEACRDTERLRRAIKKCKKGTGISIKPKTRLTRKVLSVITRFDLVLIMTVEPGFGGQAFIHDVVPKIATLREQYDGLISVDGGINGRTGRIVCDAGADVLVAGSFIFNNANRKKAITLLKS